MKKVAIVSLFVAVAMGGAYAASLAVPFFADAAGAWIGSSSAPAGPGAAGFIGIKNTSASTLTISVRYFLPDGSEVTPTANTFALTSQQGTSFRPFATDSGSEGTGPAAGINSTSANGSATINWSSNVAGDVVGRYLEVNSNLNRSAYTLPAGN